MSKITKDSLKLQDIYSQANKRLISKPSTSATWNFPELSISEYIINGTEIESLVKSIKTATYTISYSTSPFPDITPGNIVYKELKEALLQFLNDVETMKPCTSCAESCIGSCKSTCGSNCTGCKGCSGNCNSCSGGLWCVQCYHNCSKGCSGCRGCGGCSTTCSASCDTNCSNTCSSGCGDTCSDSARIGVIGT